MPLRFPEIKIAMSEGDIGWVPMLADRLDYVHGWSGLGRQAWPSSDITPTEVLLRNFWFCSLDDPSIWPIRERIGVDHIMVEVDYPHADSTWPETRGLPGRATAGLSVDEQRLVCHENAAELLRHPLPRPSVARPSAARRCAAGGVTVHIEVDRDRCIGSGNCSFFAASTFLTCDADLKVVVVAAAEHGEADADGDIRAAAEGCPVKAITIREK